MRFMKNIKYENGYVSIDLKNKKKEDVPVDPIIEEKKKEERETKKKQLIFTAQIAAITFALGYVVGSRDAMSTFRFIR